jgi:AN1-type zinc finger protein 1
MEFSALGSRCSDKACGQLDFLPLQCLHCKATFCAAHSSPACHACVLVITEPRPLGAESSTLSSPRCGAPDCTEIVTLASRTNCIHCGMQTCLRHRYQDQHCCALLKAAIPLTRHAVLDAVKAAGAALPAAVPVAPRLPSAGAANSAGGGASSSLAEKVRRMRIKSKATINSSIPELHRLFIEVGGPAVCPPPAAAPLCLCVSRQWTVGTLLDVVCKARGVANPNATTADDERRLHVVYDSGAATIVLPFGSTLDALDVLDGARIDVVLGRGT